MAALKPREIERFISNPDFAHAIYLIYGPDQGLVSERAAALASKSDVDQSDPFNLIRLSAEEATSDPLRIVDEANTISMFGGKRLLWISGKTNRDLMKCIKPLLDEPPPDSILIIEAGDLAKSTSLRKSLENNKNSLCIPCYQDTDAALNALIDEEIVSRGLQISSQARTELRGLLGDNRMVSRNELKKLALYCEGHESVSVDDIRAMVGDSAMLVINDIADAAANGQAETLQALLPKAVSSGSSPDMILAACLRHFQMLQKMRVQIETHGKSARSLVDSVRPPIHFSRKDQVASALNRWTTKKLSRALLRLHTMILECRRNANAAPSITGTTLLAISLEARAA